jgi:hypothetical protein
MPHTDNTCPHARHHHRRDRFKIPATASARLFDVPSPTSHTEASSCSLDRVDVDPGTSSTSVLRSTHRAAALHMAHESSYTMH